MGLNRSKNLSSAKSTADVYFSRYIRLRDSDSNGMCKCITCDTVKHWKDMDCGHFQSRRYTATRYHEQNANQSGEQYLHGKEIDLKFGSGTAEFITKLARSIYKLNKNEVMSIAKEYKSKMIETAKQKGLKI
jgi:hypothetical protein